MSGRKRTPDPADNTPVLTRRAVVGGAGALIVSFTFAPGWAQETGVERRRRNENAGPKLPGSLDNDPFLDAWIRVDSQGAVTAFTGKVEFGQGIKTALLQVVAEELEVALEQVKLITADTAATPNEGFTSGSHSVQDSGTALRNAAAQVRDLLIAEAGARFNVPANQLRAENGTVMDAGGRRLTYGEIVAPNLLHVRAQPTSALKNPHDFKVMSRAVQRTDIPGKLTGGVAYVQDLRLPGMLHARIVRPPGYGAKLKSIEAGAVEKMPGVVKIIRDGNFLAVVARREFQAIKGMRALAEAAQWEENAHLPKGTDVETLLSSLTPKDTTIFETKGAADEGGAGASAQSAAATYTRPYLSHGSIGPSCAVGHFIDGTVTVWTHTQGVYPDRQAIAEMLGFAPEKVRCIHMEGSGCYGHNGADDAAGDAALPIRVQWMREQEQAWEPFGPAMMAKVNATLDAAGRIASWNYGVWSNTHSMRPGPAGALLAGQHMTREFPPPVPRPLPQPEGGGDRNAIPLYVLPNAKVVHHFLPDMPLRVSALRSLGAYLNIYSIESFMDELALAAGADPVEFRLKHLEDPRAADVVRKAAEEFGWSTRERGGRGRGCGFAFARYKNLAAYCAIAMQIRVDLERGHISVGRVIAAVDAGQIINPDGVCNQIEGAIVQSLSWTMFESVSFDEARITSLDWTRYPIMRFDSVPESVSVYPLDRPGRPFLGCGEAGQGPAAAALANALADATGKRMRDLPLSPKRVKGMLTAMTHAAPSVRAAV